MYEILFRGKRVDNGEWTYGYYCPKPYSHFPCEATIFPSETIDRDWHGERVDPETVGQFAGLTDKNGVRIFEGDILQCNNNPQDLIKVVFGEFGVIDVETETAVDNVIGWHYEVLPTDPLSKFEPFCLPMPLTEFYINRCENVADNNHFATVDIKLCQRAMQLTEALPGSV